jgi:1-acyl-sn-glycerol-3-phosphate acyltransferase
MGQRIWNDRLSRAAGSGAPFLGRPQPLFVGFRLAADTIRAALRLLSLFLTLLEIAARFALLRLRRRSRITLRDRAEWLHRSCCLILRRLRLPTDFRGPRPARGLVCANHLSYLDIAVFAAAAPCVFVSKREVKSWPALGFFALFAGTIFLDRENRANADAAAAQMAGALDAEVPVLLFPEGTSTDGSKVLRFHPTLLEPAILKGLEIVPAAIAYRLHGGQERELCYYGDISFVPHLLRTLGRAAMAAEVEFYPESLVYPERKAAALDLHDKVEAMRRRMTRDSVE